MGQSEEDPDAALVKAAVGGDRSAFGTLLERHYDRIHGLAWQLCGSRSDADDIAQDVCCTLVTKLGSFRGEAKFSTWLCALVVNEARAFHRRRRIIGRLAQGFSVVAKLAALPDGRDVYDAIWMKSAIARLKPAYRETVALVIGQQLTHGEAADILGIAEATVSWRMHEIRKMLTQSGSDEA